MVALVTLGSCRAIPRGYPARTHVPGAGGGHRGVGGGADRRHVDDSGKRDGGMVIEDDDDVQVGGVERGGGECVNLEFPEEMIAEALSLAEEGQGELGPKSSRG